MAYPLTNNRIVSMPLCVPTPPPSGTSPPTTLAATAGNPVECAGPTSVLSIVELASSPVPGSDGRGAAAEVSEIPLPVYSFGRGAVAGGSEIPLPARPFCQGAALTQFVCPSTALGTPSPPRPAHGGGKGLTAAAARVLGGSDGRGDSTPAVRQITYPALADVLHLHDPSSTPFAHLFPALAHLSSAELVEMSAKYLKTRAAEVAAAAAAASIAADGSLAIDRRLVAAHADRASQVGLRALLLELRSALSVTVLQRLSPQLTLVADRVWPPGAHALWGELVAGSKMLIPDGFIPSGPPLPVPPPEVNTQLAFEILVRGDQAGGRACVIPLRLLIELAADADMQLNEIPVSIAMKEGKTCGRLVVDATRGGLNSPEKKARLTEKWGDIALPDLYTYCTLFVEVSDRFPGEQLHVYKMDKEAWYRRVPVHVDDAPLSFFVIHVDGVPQAVLPLGMTFGLQDSNFTANFAGGLVDKLVADHEVRSFGGRVSALYNDDTVGFLPQRLIPEEMAYTTELFESCCGKGVIKLEKSTTGPRSEVIGFTFDCERRVVSLSIKAFLKMTCVLFRELPAELSTLTRVPLKQLQRMAALMIRNACLIHFLRPFSRGASANSAGRRGSMVSLSHQTIVDVYMWRAVFSVAHSSNVSWMTLPIKLPPLLHVPSHVEDEARRGHWLSQAAAATVVLHVDASKSESLGGIGFTESRNDVLASWGSFPLPDTLRSLDYTGLTREADINICESFAFIVAVTLVAPSAAGSPSSPTHIHVWTDNTSALCWMTSFRAAHPLVLFFLQLLSHIQARFCLVITAGHIPGLLNVLADAASRDFACQNGRQSFETLSKVLRHTALPPWVSDTMPAMSVRSEATWHQALETLTRVASMPSPGMR